MQWEINSGCSQVFDLIEYTCTTRESAVPATERASVPHHK